MENDEKIKENMEGAPAENGVNDGTSKVEEIKKEEEKTFTRDEVNKMINAERIKERQAVISEYETKKAEAEKLAKMDADEKKDYELSQWKERAEKAEKQNSINLLKSETMKQASEKGISLEFINTLNFEYETAETIKSKLELLEKAVKKEREIAISEYSKEPTPQTGDRGTPKDISQMSYTELAEYLNKHPEVNL